MIFLGKNFEFYFMGGFQNVGNFTCVTLHMKEEELMLPEIRYPSLV